MGRHRARLRRPGTQLLLLLLLLGVGSLVALTGVVDAAGSAAAARPRHTRGRSKAGSHANETDISESEVSGGQQPDRKRRVRISSVATLERRRTRAGGHERRRTTAGISLSASQRVSDLWESVLQTVPTFEGKNSSLGEREVGLHMEPGAASAAAGGSAPGGGPLEEGGSGQQNATAIETTAGTVAGRQEVDGGSSDTAAAAVAAQGAPASSTSDAGDSQQQHDGNNDAGRSTGGESSSSSASSGSDGSGRGEEGDAGAQAQAAALRMVLSEEDLGITHLIVPHVLYSQGSPFEYKQPGAGRGNMHVWLKHLLLPDGDVDVRGFTFFESTQDPINARPKTTDHHMRVPDFFYNANPRLQLTPIGADGMPSTEPTELTRLWGISHDRPWLLTGTLNVSEPVIAANWLLGFSRSVEYAPVYSLPDATGGADGTDGGGDMEDLLGEPFLEHELAPAPQYHVVLCPYPNMTAAAQMSLVSHHVSYHRRLGFSSWLAYIRPQHAAALSADPRAQRLARDGLLQLVRWEQPLHWLPDIHQHPAQGLYYNHALLAYYGRAAWLAVVDLDEFLIVPQPVEGGIDAIARTCWRGAAYACIQRMNFVCALCNSLGIDETQEWTRVAPQDDGGAGKAGRDPRYRHPLQRYNKVLEVYPWTECKAIASPQHVYSWFVHDGLLVGHTDPDLVPLQLENPARPLRSAKVNSTCAAWLHVRSMVKGRETCERHEKHGEECPRPFYYTDWQWVFEDEHWGGGGGGGGRRNSSSSASNGTLASSSLSSSSAAAIAAEAAQKG